MPVGKGNGPHLGVDADLLQVGRGLPEDFAVCREGTWDHFDDEAEVGCAGLAQLAPRPVGNDNGVEPAYLAAFDGVVDVTAVNDQRLIYDKDNRGDYVDIAAPGVRVWTAEPGGGRYQSGTSFAAPFITALVAVDAAKGHSVEKKAVVGRQGSKAIDLGPPGGDKIFGFGMVNVAPTC